MYFWPIKQKKLIFCHLLYVNIYIWIEDQKQNQNNRIMQPALLVLLVKSKSQYNCFSFILINFNTHPGWLVMVIKSPRFLLAFKRWPLNNKLPKSSSFFTNWSLYNLLRWSSSVSRYRHILVRWNELTSGCQSSPAVSWCRVGIELLL